MKFFKNYYVLQNAADDQSSGGGGADDKKSDSGNQKDQDSGDQGQKGEKDKDSGNPDLNSLPEWAQKELKSLRGESAKYRTDNKGLKDRLDNFEKNLKKVLGGEEEGDDEAPEVKIEKLQGHAQSLEVKTAFMEIAIENSISKAEYEYFEFLMGKALNGLKDDEELTEEALEEIISKCKTSEKKPAQSSVNNGQDGKGQKKDSSVSVEEFAKMTMTQKSALFQKNRELYNSLFEQAKSKKLI
jgi:hypothetical protein